jgi:hypothetical protein
VPPTPPIPPPPSPPPPGSGVRDARPGLGVPRRGSARRPSRGRPRGPAPVRRRGRRGDSRRGRTRAAGEPGVGMPGMVEHRGLVPGVARGSVLGMSRKLPPGTHPRGYPRVRASGVPPGVSRGRAGHGAPSPPPAARLSGAHDARRLARPLCRGAKRLFPFSFSSDRVFCRLLTRLSAPRKRFSSCATTRRS